MTRDYGNDSNFTAQAKIYTPDEWYHLSSQGKQQVVTLKSEQGWINGQTPPHGFVLDNSGFAKPSTHLVAAVQQYTAQTPSPNPQMIQLPPPPQGNHPPVPPVIDTSASNAGASFGRRGTRQPPDQNSVGNVSMVSINGQSYSGAIYDSRGNRLG